MCFNNAIEQTDLENNPFSLNLQDAFVGSSDIGIDTTLNSNLM